MTNKATVWIRIPDRPALETTIATLTAESKIANSLTAEFDRVFQKCYTPTAAIG
jgi:hypothetical protein